MGEESICTLKRLAWSLLFGWFMLGLCITDCNLVCSSQNFFFLFHSSISSILIQISLLTWICNQTITQYQYNIIYYTHKYMYNTAYTRQGQGSRRQNQNKHCQWFRRCHQRQHSPKVTQSHSHGMWPCRFKLDWQIHFQLEWVTNLWCSMLQCRIGT